MSDIAGPWWEDLGDDELMARLMNKGMDYDEAMVTVQIREEALGISMIAQNLGDEAD